MYPSRHAPGERVRHVNEHPREPQGDRGKAACGEREPCEPPDVRSWKRTRQGNLPKRQRYRREQHPVAVCLMSVVSLGPHCAFQSTCPRGAEMQSGK